MVEPNGFGKKLRELRKARKLTQIGAVKEYRARFPDAPVSQASWSSWELRRFAVSGEIIERLSEFFGVEPGEFYR